MISLHVPTIYALTVAVMTLHMIMLCFAWFQNRAVRALLCWGLGNGGMGTALTLLYLRGSIPSFLSIDIAYFLLIASSGLILMGALGFEGKRINLAIIYGGAAIWLVVCQIPEIHSSVTSRTIIVSGLLSLYVGAAALTFYGGRRERLLSRWPLIILMGINSLLFAVRIPLALFYPLSQSAAVSVEALQSPWFAVASAAVLFFNTAMNFLFLSMVKERAELVQKHTADTDQLTGLLSRRAFFEQIEGLAARGPIALAMMDLDHFKQINDRFGHSIGDETLRQFAETLQHWNSPEMIAGRLGGEEFAIALSCSKRKLRYLIEAMKEEFENAGRMIGEEPVGATFSAGLAEGHGLSVAEVVRRADSALYQAKNLGRNRVYAHDERSELHTSLHETSHSQIAA